MLLNDILIKKINLEAYLQIFQASLDIIGSISDGLAAKEMQRLDARDKALSESYKNELRFIEQSGFSNEQKEKKKAKLAAENEAKQKQIDKERVTALRKQAALNKALSIVSIIAKTAEGIMSALLIPIYGEIKAIAVAATGAAELAAVIATPRPQYAKGRKGGKACNECHRRANGHMGCRAARIKFLPHRIPICEFAKVH